MKHPFFNPLRHTVSRKALSVLLTLGMILPMVPVAYAASLTIAGSLAENTLNGAIVGITLTDDTFLDSTLDTGNFLLNNAPSGVSISSVTYTSDTTANLTLSFNNTDFDTDVPNFNITINAAELTSNAGMTSNNLTITAIIEASPALTISGSLSESNLNGAFVSMSLANDTFKDSTLDKNNFTINNAPSGTTIASVSYGSSTAATLSFAFNGTDFDSNITNFTITIGSGELTSNANLTSNTLTITAVVEASPALTISGSLTETNLNGATVSMSLANDTFKDSTLDKSNFTLNNAPSGTTVSSVSYTNSTAASLVLSFNNTDFDTNVTNFSITINAGELTSNANLTGNALTITAVQESADTTKPTISSVSVDSTKKIITLTMNENINRVGTLSDLKSKIRFADDGSNYDSLSSGDSVGDIDGTQKKIIITFTIAISGSSNRIKILSGAIKDAAENQNNELTTAAFSSSGTSEDDTTKPTLEDVTVDHTLKVVTLYFSENIERATSSTTALKNKIEFASDGSNFDELSADDTISDPDGDDEKLVITLNDEIAGTKNKIRIKSDALEDAAGNKNNEIITSAFRDEDSEKPYIKNAVMDSTKKMVTITFQEDIKSLTTLKNRIKLATNGTDFESLASDDTVSDPDGSDNVLEITFDEALSGSKNKIKVLSGAVEDESGNKNVELITDAISQASSALTIASITVGEDNQEVKITFSKIVEPSGSLSALKGDIEFASDGSTFDELSDDDEISDISGKILTIIFDTPIAGTKNKIRITEGALEDEDGNENAEITSSAFSARSTDTEKPALDDVEVSSTNVTVTLLFTENISRSGTAEELKSNVKFARDGVNFNALGSEDTVVISGNKLVVTFQNALSGSQNKIKVLADAVEDADSNGNEEFKTYSLQLNSADRPFEDLDGHWAKNYVMEIYDLGIVNGRDENHYAPDANLNRAELAKLALKAFGITVPPTVAEDPFLDVANDAWYATFIEAAKQAGIVGGYPDGRYFPEKDVSRVEALKIILEASGLSIGDGTTFFRDTESSAWYQKYLAYAQDHGIAQGYSDGSFGPNKPVTRAEIAKMLLVVLKLQES